MKLSNAHLTYCTNIHSGESWEEHFNALKKHFPAIKRSVSPEQEMGIGLRLSDIASRTLIQPDNLEVFRNWLEEQDAYVFTMNGFPFGSFHNTVVKDQVHAPDWTTDARVDYTKRLFSILGKLLPAGVNGGISTSPLSYRRWFTEIERAEVAKASAKNILSVAADLIRHRRMTGAVLHLDIEPEPDGLLESGDEFISWFENVLDPIAQLEFGRSFGMSASEAAENLRQHVRLCYDVCHFAIGYEDHLHIISRLAAGGIRVGKIQVSAALKAVKAPGHGLRETLGRFDEPTYLHQVIAKSLDGNIRRYADLPEALADTNQPQYAEWRAHFHVPVFLKQAGMVQSTQDDIIKVLEQQKLHSFTNHLEVETYTWEVLPADLQLPIEDSIARELNWVKEVLS